jgi:hypothetical protein
MFVCAWLVVLTGPPFKALAISVGEKKTVELPPSSPSFPGGAAAVNPKALENGPRDPSVENGAPKVTWPPRPGTFVLTGARLGKRELGSVLPPLAAGKPVRSEVPVGEFAAADPGKLVGTLRNNELRGLGGGEMIVPVGALEGGTPAAVRVAV